MQIIRLEDLAKRDHKSAGGKARGLGELVNAGLKIAKGFVIIGLASEDDYAAAANYYKTNGYKSVAVRSSATNEDGTEFSNAGQYTTILGVEGETAFIDALKTCIASLDNKTAESYSAFFALTDKAQMSIVVQEMVDARAAGVCFSFDPITGDKNHIVEAVAGLGESLVAGTDTAERYTVPVETPDTFLGDGKLLSRGMVSKIIADMKTAVAHFGIALDMEFAVSKGEELVWLQARPITTSKESTVDELDSPAADTDVITSCNIGEMLPGVVTPLSITTTVRAIDYGLRNMLIRARVYKNFKALPAGYCITNFSNQLFFNFTPLYKMAAHVALTGPEQIEFAICGESLGVPIPAFKRKNRLTRACNMVRYMRFVLGGKKAVKRADRLAAKFKIPVTGDVAADYRAILDNIKNLNKALNYHYQTSSYSGAMSSALKQILIKTEPDPEKVSAAIASVLTNIDDIESVDILRSMRRIAAAVLAADTGAGELTPEQLLELINKSGGEVRSVYNDFLTRHGHRAIREAELRSRSWQSDTRALAEHLLTIIKSGNLTETARPDDFPANLEKFLAPFKGFKRKMLRYLVKQARLGVRLREFTKSKFIKVTDEFKIAFDALSARLVALGALPDADLVFFLTIEEIGELINHKKIALIKRAMQRKRVFAEQQTIRFAKVNVGKPKPIERQKQKGERGTVLPGTPISRGTVTGIARVIKTADDAKTLQKNEIMVAEFTDIGWSPYYCLVGGLVTEIGSALSHGAVVAREYALPLIANVQNATGIIKTGDRIELDATRGTVTIL
jgi:pyruvate,water dikinase